ncbi:MAG: energy-coupling factor transporter transmembrane protein EcfT [Desulfuromonadales bacterium]
MSLIEALSLGQFSPGNTPLHKLSPGLKLAALPGCVIASFICTGPFQLLALTVLAALLTVAADQAGKIWISGLWQLRYLFLVTVLLHTVLSPGHTLFGMSWLSLDGLLLGLRTAGQLALAVTFSSLLTLTTMPIEVVRSLEKMFSFFSFPKAWSREIILFFSLILYFVPLLREEAATVARRFEDSRPASESERSLLKKAKMVVEMVHPLLFGLLDKANTLADRLASGEPLFDRQETLEKIRYPLFVQVFAGCAWTGLIGIVLGGLP